MTDTPNVSVVVPTFNRCDLLRECLGSVQLQTYPRFETVVVDDGSSEDVNEFLRSAFPLVRCVQLDRNRGFAAVANAGIAATNAKYVLLLNNDMTLERETIGKLVEAMEADESLAAAAPLMMFADGSDRVYAAGDRMLPGGRPESIGYGQPLATFERCDEPFGVSAGAALYRREVFDCIGVFDESFVAYFEDSDWNFRARLAGYGFKCVFSTLAFHRGSASLNGKHVWRAKQCYRNHALLMIKNMPLALAMKNAGVIARERVHQNVRLFSVSRAEKNIVIAATTLFSAWINLIAQTPGALAKRAHVQRTRKLSNHILEGLLVKSPPSKGAGFSVKGPGGCSPIQPELNENFTS